MDAAAKIARRLDALAAISEEPGRLTRRFATPAMAKANALVSGWMRDAGMTVRQDAIGNLIAHYPGARANAKTLLLGSHLDTVPNAGKFDGALGVVTAISCVESLAGRALPFAIEIIAFADEEGTRFATSYLGSSAVAGKVDKATIHRIAPALRAFGGDPESISTCRMDPKKLLAYVEVHIEQGPVLEEKKQAVAVVSAISGQTRASLQFEGHGGHAGTVPMRGRRDALCAGAEFVLMVERRARGTPGLVATVGEISAQPGASNVIPGGCQLSLDVRHSDDRARTNAVRLLQRAFRTLLTRRKLRGQWRTIMDTPTVECSGEQAALLETAARRHQRAVLKLPSGAGHDAVMMAGITPVAMLFVRCRSGISHHPGEHVSKADMRVALAALNDYISLLAEKHEFT